MKIIVFIVRITALPKGLSRKPPMTQEMTKTPLSPEMTRKPPMSQKMQFCKKCVNSRNGQREVVKSVIFVKTVFFLTHGLCHQTGLFTKRDYSPLSPVLPPLRPVSQK